MLCASLPWTGAALGSGAVCDPQGQAHPLATWTLPSTQQRAGLQPGPRGAGSAGSGRDEEDFCTHRVPVGAAAIARCRHLARPVLGEAAALSPLPGLGLEEEAPGGALALLLCCPHCCGLRLRPYLVCPKRSDFTAQEETGSKNREGVAGGHTGEACDARTPAQALQGGDSTRPPGPAAPPTTAAMARRCLPGPGLDSPPPLKPPSGCDLKP